MDSCGPRGRSSSLALALETEDSSWRLCWEGEAGVDALLLLLLTGNSLQPVNRSSGVMASQ